MDDRINENLLCRMLDGDGKDLRGQSCDLDGRDSKWGLVGYPLAMVYSTVQSFDDIYDLDKALMSGTVFKELDLPFAGRTVTKEGGYHG